MNPRKKTGFKWLGGPTIYCIEIERKIEGRQADQESNIFHGIMLNIWDVNLYGTVGKCRKMNPEFCSRDGVRAILANMAIAFG